MIFQKQIYQTLIKIQAFFIDLSNALRKHPGPGDGKAVPFDPQFGHQLHIFRKAVIMITGDITVLCAI